MGEPRRRSFPKTILVTRHDKIGDFVLVLPLCRAIKSGYPNIRIGVLVSKVNFDFACALEFIDFVICYDGNFHKTLRAIRKESPDISISCYIDNRLGALLLAAKIPTRIAPSTKIAQVFFNQRIIQRRSRVERTEWEYNLALAYPLFNADSLVFAPPLIKFSDLRSKSRRVIFHPGSGGSSEGNLKPSDYVRLARRIAAVPGFEVTFTFGPSDEAACKEVKSVIDFPATIVAEPMPLIQFCKLIAQSRLFVSTSTGPMHLAGAVNTPTLSFFGASLFASYRRWAPLNEHQYQSNFLIPHNYDSDLVDRIENHMLHKLEMINIARVGA